jgi:two-component system sensor histidine kinase BaeS
MRTKLFLAFLAVILTALVSNLIFERLILRDFEDYVMGTREDRLYWVLASVEGNYSEEGWDLESLRHDLHWAIMLGFEAVIKDMSDNTVMKSAESLRLQSPTMRRRMEATVHLDIPEGEFEQYPLFVKGDEIGSLHVRSLSTKGLLKEKEVVFKKRGRNFLVISFLIAGGGALFLSAIFAMTLTTPLRRLRRAAGAVAAGDLTVRLEAASSDEIGDLTQSFNHMVESLQREEDLRKHLTSNIAHELRSPLAVIRAYIEGIRDGVVEKSDDYIDSLASEVDRLITLIEGIEDLTRAEASFFMKAAHTRVNLRELLGGISQAMGPMFKESGLELSLTKSDDLEISADTEKLETILRNILSNSLGNTDRGGSVSIDYGRDRGAFYIEVVDSGQGIREEDLPFIFDRFVKGGKSSGIGLGLAIVRELVNTLGGRIDTKSAPGKGTSMKVTIPEAD